ncbi:unnamed protein product [Clonostachys byssicola]|uniref:Uncharacterized protein n=1 Tax=Clonostachys byssicola TaxID=160290 RepID=A0A9N9UNN4_9HYPO|nr:unnamed protein product [Clonostachys byssicola]
MDVITSLDFPTLHQAHSPTSDIDTNRVLRNYPGFSFEASSQNSENAFLNLHHYSVKLLGRSFPEVRSGDSAPSSPVRLDRLSTG